MRIPIAGRRSSVNQNDNLLPYELNRKHEIGLSQTKRTDSLCMLNESPYYQFNDFRIVGEEKKSNSERFKCLNRNICIMYDHILNRR